MTDEIPFLRKLGSEFSELATRDELAGRSAAARRWHRPALAALIPASAVVILGVVALAPSDRTNSLAEAYAAVAPAGQVVHSVQDVTITSRGRTVARQLIQTYWDGSRLRTLTSEEGRLVSENVVTNNNVAAYLPKSNTIRESPLNLLAGDRYKDPVELFRELYRGGRLQNAGTQALNGRTVTKATMQDGNELRTWLFDQDTETPLRYSIITDDPAPPSYSFTADYITYEHLPNNLQNKRHLEMDPHPNATRTTGAVRPTDVK